jgi:hypothetical protein
MWSDDGAQIYRKIYDFCADGKKICASPTRNSEIKYILQLTFLREMW